MEILERRRGDALVVELHGRLMMGESTRRLRGHVRRVLDAGDRRIVLDLAACDYIDSAGLGELATALVRVQNSGGQLTLLNPAKRVEDLLRITRLLEVFDVYRDEETAVSSMKPT